MHFLMWLMIAGIVGLGGCKKASHASLKDMNEAVVAESTEERLAIGEWEATLDYYGLVDCRGSVPIDEYHAPNHLGCEARIGTNVVLTSFKGGNNSVDGRRLYENICQTMPDRYHEMSILCYERAERQQEVPGRRPMRDWMPAPQYFSLRTCGGYVSVDEYHAPMHLGCEARLGNDVVLTSFEGGNNDVDGSRLYEKICRSMPRRYQQLEIRCYEQMDIWRRRVQC